MTVPLVDMGEALKNGLTDVEGKLRETRLYQAAPISTNLILAHAGARILDLPRSY